MVVPSGWQSSPRAAAVATAVIITSSARVNPAKGTGRIEGDSRVPHLNDAAHDGGLMGVLARSCWASVSCESRPGDVW